MRARECPRASRVIKCYAIAMTTVSAEVIAADRPMTTVETVLARDQRTTSHRVLDRAAPSRAPTSTTTATTTVSSSRQQTKYRHHDASRRYAEAAAASTEESDARRHLPCDSHLVPAFYDDRGARSRCNAPVSATTWLWLGCLLVTLLVSSVRSAPIMTFEDRRLSTPPKWINPCGLAAENFEGDPDVVQLRDDQLLQQIVVQARNALTHAKLFRDKFIGQTFKSDFDDVHSTWLSSHYDWLPGLKEIPKNLDEKLDQEYLNKLELDTALLDAYEYMQKYAVGLEQIVWDQEDYNLEFRKQFQDTEFELRTVLCELQVALVERGVTLRPDVTRSVMASEYRTLSSSTTFRNVRDWLIFRDYMNGLEYVEQVFDYLRRRLDS